jgi:glycosyltransferase involved in cell wall biosynthesis
MISIAITVCNEHKELETLLDYLSERALSPEYEIVVQIDEQNHTPEVLHAIIDRGIKHHFFPLNKDFASYKNELFKHCSGEYIFQIDADEIPSEILLENIKELIKYNPVDVYVVPRVNLVEGLTPEHIRIWRWNVNDKGWVNFPDPQRRIYRNDPSIQWRDPEGKPQVHGMVEGYKTYINLPHEEEWSLYHNKTVSRQEYQNNLYATVLSGGTRND